MATYNKFNAFAVDIGKKVHDLNADTMKIMLTNTLPVATNAVKTDITEITAGNGYTAGGNAVSLPGYAQTSGVGKLSAVATDPVITAAGGSIGPFRYAVLYNSTAVSGNLIAWFDYGSAITLAIGESLTLDVDQTNGLFTLS